MAKLLSESGSPRDLQSKSDIFRKRNNNTLSDRRERKIKFSPSVVKLLLIAAVVLNVVSFSLFRCAQSESGVKSSGESATKNAQTGERHGESNLRNALSSFSSPAATTNSATAGEPDSSFEDTDDDPVKAKQSSGADALAISKDDSKVRPHSEPSPNEKDMPPVMDWTVVVSSNGGFEHVFLNWYKSFVKVGLDKELQLVLIADDEELYKKYQNSTKMTVKKGWEASEKFTDAKLSGDYRYGSRAYKKLVSRRPALVLDELEHGKDVLYIDIDTVLRDDPRQFFKGNYDFWGQKHRHLKTGDDNGRPTFCTGFLALRSTENTMALVRDWRDRLESGQGGLNQGAFNKAVYNCAAKDELRANALSESLFPTGNRYKKFTQEERDAVVLMHNNYCRGGDCKQTRMEEYGLWDPATTAELL
jgi:hypothetical protein